MEDNGWGIKVVKRTPPPRYPECLVCWALGNLFSQPLPGTSGKRREVEVLHSEQRL